jgi:hypothetical protein
MDPNMRLVRSILLPPSLYCTTLIVDTQFEYSPTSFLASIPTMFAFPRLSLLYSTWKECVERPGNVRVVTCREVTRVKRGRQVKVWSRPTEGTDNGQNVVGPGEENEGEEFDELILAVDADAAITVLGEDIGWMERKVLGNVKVGVVSITREMFHRWSVQYLWDTTVTHSDLDYMQKVLVILISSGRCCSSDGLQYYRVQFDRSLCSEDASEEAEERYAFSERNFKPLYFIRSYPSDKSKVEMSFDLTEYQPQVGSGSVCVELKIYWLFSSRVCLHVGPSQETPCPIPHRKRHLRCLAMCSRPFS